MNKYEPTLISLLMTIEDELNKDVNQVKSIEYQKDEANTDHEIKRFMAEKINQINEFVYTEITYNNQCFDINPCDVKAYIGSEYPKQISKTNAKRHVTPDIVIEINDHVFTVEIKTSKTGGDIPGSSVQQSDPDEWSIFVNRKTGKVTCSKYAIAFSGKIPFPDRSPRPIVSCLSVEDWSRTHVIKDKLHGVAMINDLDIVNNRRTMVNDWKEELISNWFDMMSVPSRGWFPNVLKRFVVYLLESEKNQDPAKRSTYIEKIKKSM